MLWGSRFQINPWGRSISKRKSKKMRTVYISIKSIVFISAALALSVASVCADTYSSTNFQSDIAGVAAHVDPNLVNPWGMTASPSGTIWVSDNGTGVSTLYHQDGTAVSLVVNDSDGGTE
jgi:hypothetical protein